MGPNKKRIIIIGHVGHGITTALASTIAKFKAEQEIEGDVEFMSAEQAEKEFGITDKKEKSVKQMRADMINEFDPTKLVCHSPSDFSRSSAPIDAICKKGRNGKRRW